jgi:hypothetical protein
MVHPALTKGMTMSGLWFVELTGACTCPSPQPFWHLFYIDPSAMGKSFFIYMLKRFELTLPQ